MEQDDGEGPFSALEYPEDPTIDASPALMVYVTGDDVEEHLETLEAEKTEALVTVPVEPVAIPVPGNQSILGSVKTLGAASPRVLGGCAQSPKTYPILH